MGRKPRHWDPEHWYFVTNRVHSGRYYFHPDPEFNRFALGCLSYIAVRYNIQICCFVFMSNHFHLVARDPDRQMSNFMRDFQSTLSARVKELRHSNYVVFSSRFQASPLLDETSLRQKIAYTLTNPVKDKLVTHIDHWPGINSWIHHTTGKPLIGAHYKKSDIYDYQRQHPSVSYQQAREAVTQHYPLKLQVPSCFSGDTSEQRRQQLVRFVEQYRLTIRKNLTSKKVLGPKRILRRKWYFTPDTLDATPCPTCHAHCLKLRTTYLERRRQITDHYRSSISQLRKGRTDVKFPVGTIPPGWNRCFTEDDAGVDPPSYQGSG